MPPRERARGLLIKALYQWQLAGHDLDELLQQYTQLAEYGRCDQTYFNDLLGRVLDNSAACDQLIAQFADRGLEQLDAIGRAILLLAMTELQFRPDVPTKVIVNEAIKLAKRYGAAHSSGFINAVADRAAKQLRSPSEATAG